MNHVHGQVRPWLAQKGGIHPSKQGEKSHGNAYFLQGESLKRLLQGVVVGAVATMAVGFYWGGWMIGSAAGKMADNTARSAVIAAIAPICVEQFQKSADASTNMLELKKISSYQQAAFVEKGGWATMPGSTETNSGVSQACAKMLNDLR